MTLGDICGGRGRETQPPSRLRLLEDVVRGSTPHCPDPSIPRHHPLFFPRSHVVTRFPRCGEARKRERERTKKEATSNDDHRRRLPLPLLLLRLPWPR